MLVIGSGATGAQVASVFNAFGARVQLFEAGPRILRTEDQESRRVAAAFRAPASWSRDFGASSRSSRRRAGRMIYAKDGVRDSAEAALVVAAVGWTAAPPRWTSGDGVETDGRGFVRVDAHLRTSAPHVFAAGDVTGPDAGAAGAAGGLRGGDQRCRGR